MKHALCAHPACECHIPPRATHCSDACRTRPAGDAGPCACGHATCGVDLVGTYGTPDAVVRARGLSRDDRVALLERWRADAEALEQAAAEGMAGGEPSLLQRVLRALEALGAEAR